MPLSNDLYQARKAGDAIDREMEEAAEALEARVAELEALLTRVSDRAATAPGDPLIDEIRAALK
jgi:hypothetical protein